MTHTKVRSWSDLKQDPRVESTSDERSNDDGFWVYLKPEFINDHMECGVVHEKTFADIRWQMNKTVRKRLPEEM
jgi:hypothetical protein